MKVSESSKSNKTQPVQGVKSIVALAQNLGNGSAEADALLKEFSEVMDKIAAKLKDSPSAKKVNDFSDFGIGLPELVKPEPTAKEKPILNSKDSKEDSSAPVKEIKSDVRQSSRETSSDEKSLNKEQAPASPKEVKVAPNSAAVRSDKKEMASEASKQIEVQSQPLAVKTPEVTTPNAEQVAAAESSAVGVPSNVKSDATAVDAKGLPKNVKADSDKALTEAQSANPQTSQEQGQKQQSTDASMKLPEIFDAKQVEQADSAQSTQALDAGIRVALAKAVDAMLARTQVESIKHGIEKDVRASIQGIKQVTESGVARGAEDHKIISPAGSTSNNIGSFARNAESSARAEAPRAAKAMSQAAGQRTMEKVESALKEAAKSRDGKTISLRLDPPELGSVKIDVSLRDGNLHARIVAETPAVNQYLRDKSHELQSMLRKIGLAVDSVSVSIGNEQRQGDQQPSAWAQQGKGAAVPSFVQGDVSSSKNEAERVVNDHWVA